MDIAFFFGAEEYTVGNEDRNIQIHLLGALRALNNFSYGTIDISISIFCFSLVERFLTPEKFPNYMRSVEKQWREESISGWFYVADPAMFSSLHQSRSYYVVKNVAPDAKEAICGKLTKCKFFEGAIEVSRESFLQRVLYYEVPIRTYSLFSKTRAAFWEDFGCDQDRYVLKWLRRVGFSESESSINIPPTWDIYLLSLLLLR